MLNERTPSASISPFSCVFSLVFEPLHVFSITKKKKKKLNNLHQPPSSLSYPLLPKIDLYNCFSPNTTVTGILLHQWTPPVSRQTSSLALLSSTLGDILKWPQWGLLLQLLVSYMYSMLFSILASLEFIFFKPFILYHRIFLCLPFNVDILQDSAFILLFFSFFTLFISNFTFTHGLKW